MHTPTRLPPDVIRKVLEDEEACLGVFFKWRWPCGFVCPRCAGREGRRIARRPAWRCVACNHHARITAGTALHKSRLPLSTWLHALIFVGDRKQSVSALQLQIDLRFGCYRTAFKMLHIIRDVMDDAISLHRGLVELALRRIAPQDVRDPLPALTADDDEDPEEGTLLAVAVERLEVDDDSPLPKFGRMMLATFPLGTSWTDVRLALLPDVCASPSSPPITSVIGRNFVDWIGGTFHGISAKYIAAYAREFVFRFNHRRHASILPGIIGKRLMRQTSRRRRDLTKPRPLLPPMTPVDAADEPEEDDGLD